MYRAPAQALLAVDGPANDAVSPVGADEQGATREIAVRAADLAQCPPARTARVSRGTAATAAWATDLARAEETRAKAVDCWDLDTVRPPAPMNGQRGRNDAG